MTRANETVFVTGACGFIGLKLIPRLLSRGYQVIATDVAGPLVPHDPRVVFYRADIRDIARHAVALSGRCDAILHCGGVSGPMLSRDNPAEVLDINIRGTSQLLSLAAGLNLRRFVGLSSVSAYGDTKGLEVVDETAPLTATSFYGTSKAASDLVVQTFAACEGLSAASLRIGWVYGPGRVTDALVQPIVRSATGAAYTLPSGADHRLQFVHVEDVVSAIMAALVAEHLPASAYNVDGAESIGVGDMLAMIAAQLPSVKASIGPGLLEGTEVQGLMALDAARRDLGWTPRVAFSEGLSAYVAWLQRNPY